MAKFTLAVKSLDSFDFKAMPSLNKMTATATGDRGAVHRASSNASSHLAIRERKAIPYTSILDLGSYTVRAVSHGKASPDLLRDPRPQLGSTCSSSADVNEIRLTLVPQHNS